MKAKTWSWTWTWVGLWAISNPLWPLACSSDEPPVLGPELTKGSSTSSPDSSTTTWTPTTPTAMSTTNGDSGDTTSGDSSSPSTSSTTESDTESGTTISDSSSNTGEMDSTDNARPKMTFPAEAIDLDPAPNVVHHQFRAARYTYPMGHRRVEGYAYNDQVPGPTIRAKIGDTLVVEFFNDLDVPTTIHWHGMHVPFAMDGVAWQGAPVMPGETFVYTFDIQQTGTYWYHPHVDTERQVDLGLYGALIVEDPQDPKPDQDLVFVMDAWGEWEPDIITSDHHEERRTGDHGHQEPFTWSINGQIDPILEMPGGQIIRARFINVSNIAYLDLYGFPIRHIASDQGILPALQTPTRMLLTPADRFDAEWLVGTHGFDIMRAPYTLFGPSSDLNGDKQTRLWTTSVVNPQPAPPGLSWPFSGEAVSEDPAHTDWIYVFHGDPHTNRWTINGETFPNITIKELPLHTDAVIEVRNLSGSEHPFHLHGHGFEVLSVNGIAPPYKTFEDNINIRIGERVRLRLIANNPGDWMTHCHILPHADEGMMTVLRVLEEP